MDRDRSWRVFVCLALLAAGGCEEPAPVDEEDDAAPLVSVSGGRVEPGEPADRAEVPADPCAGVSCDDGDPCTEDACKATTGLCVHEPVDGACDGVVFVHVRDETGAPLPGAEVRAGAVTGKTDPEGNTYLQGLPTDANVVVRGSMEGYTPATARSRAMVVPAQATLTLRAKGDPHLFSGDAGADVTRDGIRVLVPPHSVVGATGAIATGEVALTIVPFDPSKVPLDESPAPLVGTMEGEEVGLESVFMVEIGLEVDGEPATLAPGAKTHITVPIPEALQDENEEGDEIPVWSLDEETASWTYEGKGKVLVGADGKKALAFDGPVASWWNCDQPWTNSNCVDVTVLEAAGLNVIGANVTLSGLSYQGGQTVSTGYDGRACIDFKRGDTVSVKASHPDHHAPADWPIVLEGWDEGASCDEGGGPCAKLTMTFLPCDPADCTLSSCASCCLTCEEDEFCQGGACYDLACSQHAWPGCDGCPCESCICAKDPYCCTKQWDSLCARQCEEDCGGSMCLGADTAVTPWIENLHVPGTWCEGEKCVEGTTCHNGVCVSVACLPKWKKDSCHDGCTARSAGGCDGCPCQKLVCAEKPDCCTANWSQACAEICAVKTAGVCPELAAALREKANPTLKGPKAAGCKAATLEEVASLACHDCVCDALPYCCSVGWDDVCTKQCAACDSTVCPAVLDFLEKLPCSTDTDCPSGEACGGGWCAPGDCVPFQDGACADGCSATGEPGGGCENCACQDVVCDTNPYCCLTDWGPFCAAQCDVLLPGHCSGP